MSQIEQIACSSCGLIKMRTRSRLRYVSRLPTGGIRSSKYLYKDEKGKCWQGRKCPACVVEANRQRQHRLGKVRPRHLQEYHSIRVGLEGEKIAMGKLLALGKVRVSLNEKPSGPDLTFWECGEAKRVEVKRAVRHLSHGKYEFWKTEPVKKNRRDDDFIAIVLPDNSIIFESMAKHLAACGASGRRNVTAFVKRKE